MSACAYPVYRQNVGGLTSCGQCRQCRLNRRRQKTTRVVLESKKHEHCLFITLTYSNPWLPTLITDKSGDILWKNPGGVLVKSDIQNFMKRVRRVLPPRSIRFWCVGEYGDKNWRPHFHLIIWGLPYDKRHIIYDAWSDPITGHAYCDPNRLDVQVPRDNWDIGSYCSSYVMKKMTNPKDTRLNGRSPEFFTSSKGIGLSFVQDYVVAMLNGSAQAYIEMHGDIPRTILIDGKKMPLDRYMRGKIIDALQIKDIATNTAQANFAQEMRDMLTAAKADPSIPKTWFLDVRKIPWALEKFAENSREQSLLNLERKQNLKTPQRTGDLNA